MPDRPRVLFIDRDPPSGFMALDRRCLDRVARTTRLVYPGRPTPAFVARCIRLTLRNDIVYAFFASEHALIPALVARLLHRRFVLVPGGYDYANVPERRYGLAARGRGWMPRLIGNLATEALPISRQTMWEFLALVPRSAPRTRLAYLAVDPDSFADPRVERRADQVVTVAYVDDESWWRKGIDRFVAAAAADPARRYVLVGNVAPEIAPRLRALAPPNLICAGRLDADELNRTLWESSVYVQLSCHETFGVAMAEAMLCGCVPVVSDSPALNEVAGPWAVRPQWGEADHETIARAAAHAHTVDTAAMRADIAERFSLARRTAILHDAVRGAA